MASRRTLKAAGAIRVVIATSLLMEIKDPRVQGVTITKVEVTEDMRQAKVYFTVLGGEGKERNALRGLQSAAGFLQSKIARRIDTRYTPTLQFSVDQGVKNLMAVTKILEDERAEREAANNAVSNDLKEDDDKDDNGSQDSLA